MEVNSFTIIYGECKIPSEKKSLNTVWSATIILTFLFSFFEFVKNNDVIYITNLAFVTLLVLVTLQT